MISFEEFQSVNHENWEQAAADLLKGKPLSKLNWKYEPDMPLEAYYDTGQIKKESHGLGGLLTANEYVNLEVLNLDSGTNDRAMNALLNGAGGVLIENAQAFSGSQLLKSILPQHCWFGINTDRSGIPYVAEWFENQDADPSTFSGFVGSSWLKKDGVDLSIEASNLFATTDVLLKFEGIRTIEIPLHLLQQSGATIAMELGVMLSALKWMIDRAIEHEISIDSLSSRLLISTSVGTDFYHEISKLRAIRPLVYKVFKAYNAEVEIGDFTILGRTSEASESSLDPDTNYLRKTTQAFSIALGTADLMVVSPYEPFGYNEDVRRISRNIGNLIKDESYAHWVKDPLAGSYFVETLTEKLSESGWEQFQKIEAEGGIETYINEGALTEELKLSQERILKEVSSCRKTVVGVNNYPNFLTSNGQPKELKNSFHYAQDFEQLKGQLQRSIDEEKFEHAPKFQPIPVGEQAAMITARLNFATNFLGCGGFEILEKGSQNEDPADVAVICGADADYDNIEEAQVNSWKEQYDVLLIAGNPANSDTLRSWGVDEFVHIRSNVLETNKVILKMLKAI
ncbi:MAG: methylmalonyl-CoA mutase family protein [Bacteroidota bacterium]